MVDYFNVNQALQHQYNPTTRKWEPELVSGSVTTLAPTSSYDFIGLSYTGENLTTVTYRDGGATGAVIQTLALTYDGDGNLTSIGVS